MAEVIEVLRDTMYIGTQTEKVFTEWGHYL